MSLEDKILICVECAEQFVFSAGEQMFFREKNFVNNPKHCKRCKAKRTPKGVRNVRETQILCAECGSQTTVPFIPVQHKPVLCRQCFQKPRGLVAATV